MGSMHKIVTTILLLNALVAHGQPVIHQALKTELDSLLLADQSCREQINLVFTPAGRDSLAKMLKMSPDTVQVYMIRKMNETDSLNILRLSAIIREHGYPGKTLVGTPANEAAFFIIQHSKQIDRYIPLVRQAAKQKEIPYPLYAMMLDRHLMQQGKKQVYGTQIRGFEMAGKTIEQKEWKMLIWPIRHRLMIHHRRKKAGFNISLKEYARRLETPYQFYSMRKVRKMMASGR